MITNFHNTTNESGQLLINYNSKANSQDNLVREAFAHQSTWTASDVWDYLIRTGSISKRVPLTSIRRSLTTLAHANVIERTFDKKLGIYGRLEYLWCKR